MSGMNYSELKSILGKKYVSSRLESNFDFITAAEKGINSHVISNFRKYFNLSLEVTSKMLNISEPTIYRWLKNNKNLDRNSSIKIMEVTSLFLYGIDVFGKKDKFFSWLNLPNIAIGGMAPISLIGLPEGVSKVRDLLGRIEHGIFS